MNWQAIAYCLGLEILHRINFIEEPTDFWPKMVQDMADSVFSNLADAL